MMKSADQQVLPSPLLPVIRNRRRNPLAPKHLPSLSFSSAKLARVVMHQGSDVAESKSSHFLDHLLCLVHHAPHKSRCWHISGVGGHGGVRATEAVPPQKKSLQDCAWGSPLTAWPDQKMTLSLLLPLGCPSVRALPQSDSPHGHTNITLITFSKDASIISPLKISLLLLQSLSGCTSKAQGTLKHQLVM